MPKPLSRSLSNLNTQIKELRSPIAAETPDSATRLRVATLKRAQTVADIAAAARKQRTAAAELPARIVDKKSEKLADSPIKNATSTVWKDMAEFFGYVLIASAVIVAIVYVLDAQGKSEAMEDNF